MLCWIVRDHVDLLERARCLIQGIAIGPGIVLGLFICNRSSLRIEPVTGILVYGLLCTPAINLYTPSMLYSSPSCPLSQ